MTTNGVIMILLALWSIAVLLPTKTRKKEE